MPVSSLHKLIRTAVAYTVAAEIEHVGRRRSHEELAIDATQRVAAEEDLRERAAQGEAEEDDLLERVVRAVHGRGLDSDTPPAFAGGTNVQGVAFVRVELQGHGAIGHCDRHAVRSGSYAPPAIDPVRAQVETLDPDALTPRQALDALYRLRDLLDER